MYERAIREADKAARLLANLLKNFEKESKGDGG
jgi:hypothetical protein